jgi:hypothetical protein
MGRAIYLDNHAKFVAIEVNDEVVNGVLSKKFDA